MAEKRDEEGVGGEDAGFGFGARSGEACMIPGNTRVHRRSIVCDGQGNQTAFAQHCGKILFERFSIRGLMCQSSIQQL